MTAVETQVRTYGNFSSTRRRGIGGLSLAATVGVGVGLVVLVIILMLFGLIATLLWIAMLAFAALPTRISRRDGRSGYERAFAKLGFRRAARRQRTVYLAGPAGHTPDGKCRLPGLLATSELTTERETLGMEFAMLTLPRSRHYTVVINAPAIGLHLVDRPVIDQHVAGFGAWLASLAEYPELVGASVVVESAPDPGVRLRRMLASRMDDAAPPFARNVMTTLGDELATAAPQVHTKVTLTFSGSAVPGLREGRSRDEMAAHLALVLPQLIAGLRLSGCPTAEPLSSQDLVDDIRVAYDPAVALEVEEARTAGGTGLTWDAAGPTLHRESIDTYQHDRAWSRSWQMAEAPKGIIQSDQLTRLLEPHPSIDRKRVTLLYRAEDPVKAATLDGARLEGRDFRAERAPAGHRSRRGRDRRGETDRGGRGARCRPGPIRADRHRDRAGPRPAGGGQQRRHAARGSGQAAAAARTRLPSDNVRRGPARRAGIARAHGDHSRDPGRLVSSRRDRRGRGPRGGSVGSVGGVRRRRPRIGQLSGVPTAGRRSRRRQRLTGAGGDTADGRTVDQPVVRGGRGERQPGRRGWAMPGGGFAAVVEPAPEYRGTSVQVCGLWPFSAGATLPLVGVPLGQHWMSRTTVCCDPISWFLDGLILNPSMFVLGRPGLGKSSLVRRMVVGLAAWGYVPMVLSDLKPDYVELVRELGGQVVTVGRGRDSVNPLDPGPLWDKLDELPDGARGRAIADLRARRLNTLIGLVQLVRGRDRPVVETEENILAAALAVLDEERDEIPVIGDVLELIRGRHASLRAVSLDRGDDDRYDQITEALQASLIALSPSGRFGDTFARPTSNPIELDKAVVFDLSSIDDSDEHLQAAAQLVCWSYGSAAVACARLLSREGLRRQQHFFLVMDELWRMLRASSFMVDRVDAITRLNRTLGLGQCMITHTMDDLRLETEAQTAKAWGFVSRAALVALGGLAPGEMGNLATVFALSDAEQSLITGWSDMTGYSLGDGHRAEPPGLGAFLIKRGKEPGIPVRVTLTAAEYHVNDTNLAWSEQLDRRRDRR